MAKRSAKPFIRLDLDYADNPKIVELSDAAWRAHVEMILYCRKYLTDGRLSPRVITRWDSESVSELLSNDPHAPSLYKLDDGSYLLHGFEDMQETKAEVQARQQVNAANGRKGSRPKTQSVTDPVSDSGTHSKSRVREEEEKSSSAQSTSTPEGFDAWWAQWPKKVAKAAALKAYKTALKKTDALTLGQSAAQFIATEQRKGTAIEYIPNASTWLNQERWEDDTSTPPAMAPKPEWMKYV